MDIEYSYDQLQAAKLYQYTGEFCPVKKGFVLLPDWFPTDKMLEGAGVPVIELINRAKAEAKEAAKSEWYYRGVADTEKRYNEDLEYQRECEELHPAAVIENTRRMLEAQELALDAKQRSMNEREEALQAAVLEIERKAMKIEQYMAAMKITEEELEQYGKTKQEKHESPKRQQSKR